MAQNHASTDYDFRVKDALLGAQMLFVAFGALVLVPLLTRLFLSESGTGRHEDEATNVVWMAKGVGQGEIATERVARQDGRRARGFDDPLEISQRMLAGVVARRRCVGLAVGPEIPADRACAVAQLRDHAVPHGSIVGPSVGEHDRLARAHVGGGDVYWCVGLGHER